VPNPLHAWNGSGGTRTDLPLFQHDGNTWRSVDLPCLLLLRECSVLLGVLNVAAVLALSRHFFAGGWALVPGVLAGTLPQVLFSSGVVTNDGLANLLITLCLLYAVRLIDDPARRGAYLTLGLTLGLALLTKKTALFVVPVLAALAGYLIYRHRERPTRIVANMAAARGVAALVCGWWFLRNRALYGDVLGSAMEKATLGPLVQEKGLGSSYFTDRFPFDFSQSLVGRFGWMQVPLPDPVYWFYALLAAVSVAGLPLWARSRSFPAAKAAFAGLCVLGCFAGIIALNLTYSQPQGRFLFPVLGPLAVFLTAGLRGLWALLARSRVREIGPVGVAGLVTGLIAILVFVDVVSMVSLVRFYA
jgi:4-amino-4-deoxy-L-arabinose transferase-like glycosyltransferase